MKSLIISLDDLYNGPTSTFTYDRDRGINAVIADGSSRIVKFQFNPEKGWDEETAKKYLKNRKLNKVYFRKLRNGKVFLNHICLSGSDVHIQNSSSAEEVKDLFGQKSFDSLMETETRYGSDKPFVVKVLAMDFKGKDEVVAKGMKFYKLETSKIISDFSGVAVRLGHPSFFESFTKRIGNTIGSYLDEKGNPIVYSYIYPHGEAGEFRENIKIAEAQGLLESYEISVFGDPIDYELVADDKVEKEGGARILMKKWKPTSVDFVDQGALDGSRALEIANSKEDSNDFIQIVEGGKKVTITEILNELREHKNIALSDFLSIESFKKAVDAHVAVCLSSEKARLTSDKEFIATVIDQVDDASIASNPKIVRVINSKVQERKELINKSLEGIAKIAEANKINLSTDQMLLVKSNISGGEKEEEILEMVKAASKFGIGLGGVSGFFRDAAPVKVDESGVKFETVESSQIEI